MAKQVLLDEFQLTVYAPGGLPPPQYDARCRVLDESRWHKELRRAVRTVFRQRSWLRKLRVTLTR